MTDDVEVAVLSRLGSVTRFGAIKVEGRTATESAVRSGTRPGEPAIVGLASRSFATTSVVDEVLKLLPPRSEFYPSDCQPIHVAWEALAVFAAEPDGVAASYAKSMLRWREVPEIVQSLQDSVAAEFIVTTTSLAGDRMRWWVSGDAGWVGLGLSDGRVSLVPSSPADIRYTLLVDLVDAIAGQAV